MLLTTYAVAAVLVSPVAQEPASRPESQPAAQPVRSPTPGTMPASEADALARKVYERGGGAAWEHVEIDGAAHHELWTATQPILGKR